MSAAVLLPEHTAAPRRTPVWRRLLSFPVALAGLLAVLAVLTVRSRFNDPDLWWHLKTGEVIWTTHIIPTTDLFSYTTHHHAWVPHEWLSQVLIYGAYKLAGYSGLMLWLCFFTALLLIAGYALCSLYSGNAKVAFLGAMIIWFFSTVGLAIRPQVIGYLLLILELLVVHLGRTRNPRWFFCLPPLFAIWVNCHGSFFFGAAVAAAFLFCSFFDFRLGSLVSARWDSRRRSMLMLALILSAGALFLNPVGVKQVIYPMNIMLKQPINIGHVMEWRQLQWNQARGLVFLGSLSCIFLFVLIRRSELFWDELILLAVGVWLAISHERMTFVFGILAAPVVSRLLATSWEGYKTEQDRPWANATLLALSLLVAFWAFPNRKNLQRQVDEGNPAQAVEYIKTHHFAGNMLNEYVYGGYLIWAVPEYPVFVDGRADIFEWTGVLGDFEKWATLQSDPNVLLNKYKIGFCLLQRTSPMAHVMPFLPGWKTVYSDKMSVIFAR